MLYMDHCLPVLAMCLDDLLLMTVQSMHGENSLQEDILNVLLEAAVLRHALHNMEAASCQAPWCCTVKDKCYNTL